MDLALGGYGNLYEKMKSTLQDKFRPMERMISVESDESSSTSSESFGIGWQMKFRNAVGTFKDKVGGTVQTVKDKMGTFNYADAKCADLDPLGPCFNVGIFAQCMGKRQLIHTGSWGSSFNYTEVENEDFEEPDTLESWDCEFTDLLAEYGLSRVAYVNALEHVTLMGVHHPHVDVLLSRWREDKGLSFQDGEDLLYLTLGKALEFDLEKTQENVIDAAEKQVLLQEAIQDRLDATGVSQELFDQIEGYAWLFCENNIAPRKVEDLYDCVAELMEEVNEDAMFGDEQIRLDDILGPASLVVQVGPHKSILHTHLGIVRANEEFYPLDDDTQFPKTGHLLGESHWGKVFSVENGEFGSGICLKVINLNKWERKKNGIDNWNDDVASEIQAHRYLHSLNHPNIVRFEAVTMDARNLYYYMEEGFELFRYVEQHREKHWKQWKKSLIKMGPRCFASVASPWENRAKKIFRGVFEALAHLHSIGVAHRDLKLENLVVVSNGEELVGKIIDFGLTLRHGQWELDMLNEGKVGTIPFMSPEMYFNNREAYANGAGVKLDTYECYDAGKNDVWTMAHALWGFNMAVLLWESIGSVDKRFTVATHAKFCNNKDQWANSKLGLRYLAQRYGPARNCMATDNLIDLMERMLCPEADRLTAQECLEHPWFQLELEDQPMAPVSPNSFASMI